MNTSDKIKCFYRSFLSLCSFTIYGVGCLLLGFLIIPAISVLYYNSEKKRKLIFVNLIKVSWIFLIRILCVIRLISISISGREKLKNLRGTIVVANHPSLIDVVILVSIIPNPVCVVKGKLSQNFFIKKIIEVAYITNGIDVDIFFQKASEALSAQHNIIVFPEGTRTVAGVNRVFHRGYAHLSIMTGAPILPIKIDNRPKVLGKLQSWHQVGSTTSDYHLTIKDTVIPATENNRKNVIALSKIVENNLYTN